MSRARSAKILATLGPASASRDMIAQLHIAGVDVFRLNFSHGSHEDHATTYAAIRAVEDEVGHPVGILMDLQGPKLRIGTFENGSVGLEVGAKFDLRPATVKEMPTTFSWRIRRLLKSRSVAWRSCWMTGESGFG